VESVEIVTLLIHSHTLMYYAVIYFTLFLAGVFIVLFAENVEMYKSALCTVQCVCRFVCVIVKHTASSSDSELALTMYALCFWRS